MASTLKYGSKGSEVSSLQDMLNKLGYGLAVDGSFGNATQSAVRDYQTKNGLSVDGIVGTNTWGSLNSGGTGQTPTQAQAVASGGNVPGFTTEQPVYSDTQALLDAADKLSQHETSKPGEYQSSYGDQIQSMLDGILNRPNFNYDVSKDPLYAQYSEQYQRAGQKAMQDTMGQASALTGGYGNSYSQMVGQQTYQDYLEQMNNRIPELYDAAYDRYRTEGDDMRQNLGLLQGLEDSQYGKYRDTLGDYRLDLDYLTGRYDTQYERDYGKYMDEYGQWQNSRDFAYQQEQDALAQANWEKEYNFAVSQANKKSSSGGSSKKSTSGAAAAKVPTTHAEFVAMTGDKSVMREDEFSKRRALTGEYNGLKTYQDYLKMKWAQVM